MELSGEMPRKAGRHSRAKSGFRTGFRPRKARGAKEKRGNYFENKPALQ